LVFSLVAASILFWYTLVGFFPFGYGYGFFLILWRIFSLSHSFIFFSFSGAFKHIPSI
jgi:hypothetical protein